MIPYFQQFERTYYLMECSVLKCIILYRTGNSGWRTEMENLLARAQEYSFIRVIADEGAAVLEMVQKCAPKNRWGKALLDATKAQAMLYPDYLRQVGTLTEPLTESEFQVLRLLVQGNKNEDIAGTLGISVRTVKYHITNLYGKLKVTNRAQAIRAASEGHLIPTEAD